MLFDISSPSSSAKARRNEITEDFLVKHPSDPLFSRGGGKGSLKVVS